MTQALTNHQIDQIKTVLKRPFAHDRRHSSPITEQSMTHPTIPPWAAQVWVEGNTIHVACPQGEDHPTHYLAFPANAHGMHRLRSLLTNRRVESRLGTKGDQTQWGVDRDIKLLKRKIDPDRPVKQAKPKDKFAPAMRAKARDVLRGLGLIGVVRR